MLNDENLDRFSDLPEIAEQPEQLSIDELTVMIGQNINDAEIFNGSEVSNQIARGYEYYYGEGLDASPGRSNHVSKDVFNVVETAKAICLETFTQNENAVFFPPQNANDYEKAKQATSFVNYVFYRENNGYKILHDWLHDGFVAKNGIIKRWWKKEKSYSIELFHEIGADEFEALSSIPEIQIRKVDKKVIDAPIYAPMPMGGPPMPMGPMGAPGARPSGPPNPMNNPAMNPQRPGMVNPMAGPNQQMGPPQGSGGVPPMPPPPKMAGPGAAPMGMQATGMGQNGGIDQGATPPIIGMEKKEVYSGELVRERDTSHVAIRNVAPEDFLINSVAPNLEEAMFVAQRITMTKSQCLETGWDAEIVETLGFGDSQSMVVNVTPYQARHEVDQTMNNLQEFAEDQQVCSVYECYRKIDLDGDGITELYQIFWSTNKILSIEQVDEIPFNYFAPYPQPYKFYGLSIPDVIWGIQKSKSTIERQIIDNMVATNNSRYIADLGFIRNPRDLIDNRQGGVINVTKMDAILPLPTPQLNPNSFAVLEMLEADKEEATGATRLAQGMEKDAISKQNSFDTIQMLTTAANRRLMMFAKHFAEYSLKPLFSAIYRLSMTYEKKEKFIQLNEVYIPVNPVDFIERVDMTVRVALTPMEQKEQVNSLMMMHNLLSQTPALMINYGPNQQYQLMMKMMEYMNVDCREVILLNPKSKDYMMASQQQQQQQAKMASQQDQMMQLEAQLKNAQAQSLNMNAQANQVKQQLKAHADVAKEQLAVKKHQDEAMKSVAEIRIKAETEHTDQWFKENQIRIQDEEIAIKKAGGTGI